MSKDNITGRISEMLDTVRRPVEIKQPVIDVQRFMPPRPAEVNAYQSSEALLRRLADTIKQWRANLPADKEPTIIALLQGGHQVAVTSLSAGSFHGIRIDGLYEGSPCMVVAHQSTVQLLCVVAPAKEEFRRRIGFIIDGKEEQV